ncbi:Glycoside hydrolase family 71 [Macrophomina phaseolina MS6]|uniref:Glycoside hydrolase family 71 n=1 Tax=Macrophomina phaseolina (strain MS6) TaxID=1126212 RepID=K2S9M4_MACPH|nr:Glycoside hydrolase family 71 [Macrophomina phaseolina MS6]
MHPLSFHSLLPFAISLVAFFSRNASAKAVFAHYMVCYRPALTLLYKSRSCCRAKDDRRLTLSQVGHADEDHIHTDIEDAVTMGLDGFSLNIGDPRQSFVRESLNAMFDYTRDNHPNFKLFISMDLWAAGDTKPKQSATDFLSLVKDYKGHGAYQLAGPDNLPFVTTFADGGLNNVTWNEWRDELDNKIFFIPDFDGTEGYYDSDPGWWAHWQNTVDGLASWESAWPFRAGYGGEYPGDVSPDETVLQGATNHSKPYMIRM